MKDFELVFYKKPNGDCPVSDFISSLNKVMRFKLMHSLDLLELYGNKPKGDFSKFVKDGIFEVRAQNRTDITRVFYFFDKNRKIVLTNGFVKKTQKIPASELETARKYRADYLTREEERSSNERNAAPAGHHTKGPQWRPKFDDIVSDAQGRSSSQAKQTQNKSPSFGRS